LFIKHSTIISTLKWKKLRNWFRYTVMIQEINI
jgi:hypothetical protein